MKNQFYIVLILLFYSAAHLHAQCGDPGGFVFSTQQQIDDFASDNNGCTEIMGPVTISGSTITSLSGLSEVSVIHGNLQIQGTSLTTLDGLDDVEEIKGSLFIFVNNNLLNFEGLGSLTSLDGSFFVISNAALTSFAGVNNLETFGTGIEISDNQNLTSLAGINYPSCIPALTIGFNNKVSSLAGLENIKSVKGFLEISDMESLQSLEGLDSITHIEGGLTLLDNDSLTDMTGLNALTHIEGNLLVRGNTIMENFNGLDTLHAVYGNTTIERNDSLKSFTGLVEFDSIGGNLHIINNNTLLNANGLNKLEYCKNLLIEENDSLQNINAFASLTSVDGTININNNPKLQSLAGLNNVDPSDISDVDIFSCDMLSICQTNTICNYLSAGGSAEIVNNASGCDSIPQVLEQCLLAPLAVELLYFSGTIKDQVAELDWVTTTEYENEGFEIQKSKDGISWDVLDFVAGKGNSDQSTAYTYLDQNLLAGNNYYRLKQLNFDGEYSLSEIVVLKNEASDIQLEAFPNPTDEVLTVRIFNPSQKHIDLVLRDYLGRIIWSKSLDASVSDWSEQIRFDAKGIYLLTIQKGLERINKKIIITGKS